jgi:hypothetical protein
LSKYLATTAAWGSHGGRADAIDDLDGGGDSVHDVALVGGERFDEQGDATLLRVRGDLGETVAEALCGFFERDAGEGFALFGRTEDEHAAAVVAFVDVGAEVDEIVDVLPAFGAEGGVGGGDVQTFRRDHEPVEADEFEAFVAHDARDLFAAGGGDGGRFLAEREGGDFEAFIAGLLHGFADLAELPIDKTFVADGVAEAVGHELPV